MTAPAVVGFVGPSGAGKTSLLEQVVAALDRRGVRVGVVKHSCRPVPVDREGKDSHRLYGAGAVAVALAMPGQVAAFRRTAPHQPSLDEAIAALPPELEVILVEGFHWERIPRYVVLDGARRAPLRYSARGPVLGVIEPPLHAAGAPPRFAAELVEGIARAIAPRTGPGAARARADAVDSR